ncbi:NADH-quinone oxidoreductase subunit NuoN [Legionella jordanis]|uniref:NADH-quinone oxidoreductase subunit N n=1 Tax=Legionella jordanis TaxID=456 RepID=A0A0W0VDD2_9GAMM|nr:NADH-quinone oxidoreductase subunit NuoN [Legionella jordanis]KTD18139.1 NADH dehydrogenase I subunit N [Legionella jordanis]RMX00551.1 NADH-quinone oxidoreductase subunit NuoN [Legionella jordanis]RMX21332.1 NADH-quinone oxidoreductase subunit NuoN [Legionella jordanis]VEH13768.1 NADH dehydrogenase I subunit N [Legionella jordanis]HAT8714151.1 NADH-quinone oxidoreductase subunit NuoN [Legionella jordanis]
MTALLENLHIALPEMIVLVTAAIALLADLFFRHRYSSIAFLCAEIGLILAAAVSFLFLGNFKTTILGGLFVSDDVAQIMKLFIYLSGFLSFLYSRHYIDERQIPSGDYYILGLFSILGMMILVSAHSLLTIYLGLELLSLPLYAMTAIRRTNSDAAEAAMKYFIMGAIASGMLLYGLSLIYGATGKLDLLDIANAVAANWQQENTLLSFALVFILAGVGFKLAAVPFHMWAPDVYQGAPTSVTLFLSTAPKIAALGMALRILTTALPDAVSQWQQVLIIMTLLSTGIGNLLAVTQTNIKRLLAYSAISHVGYALFGILAATAAGYAAALYYIIVYALMTVAAFGLLVLLSKNGLEVEAVDDLRGLNKRNPWIAFMMLIIMFSMAGIPPTVGFFTKLLVLKALVDVHLTWLAVFGLVFAVIGAYYYVRIVKVMYFDEAVDPSEIKLAPAMNLVFSLNSLSLLLLGIFPSALINACFNAFAS